MKNLYRIALPLLSAAAIMSGPVQSQTVVHETASGDLLVIEKRGKPPFKRRVISPENQADYVRYQEISNSVLVTSTSSGRAGPAGKSIASSRARVEFVDRDEIVDIARFEETDGAETTRRWRGAPGKGIYGR